MEVNSSLLFKVKLVKLVKPVPLNEVNGFKFKYKLIKLDKPKPLKSVISEPLLNPNSIILPLGVPSLKHDMNVNSPLAFVTVIDVAFPSYGAELVPS